jgi:quinol monooxygenase YgiN
LLAGHETAFDMLVEQTLVGIQAHEPGTLAYLSHSSEQAQERVFYECYADRVAFDAHEAQPHTRRFLADRGRHLEAEPDVWWLTPQPSPVLRTG